MQNHPCLLFGLDDKNYLYNANGVPPSTFLSVKISVQVPDSLNPDPDLGFAGFGLSTIQSYVFWGENLSRFGISLLLNMTYPVQSWEGINNLQKASFSWKLILNYSCFEDFMDKDLNCKSGSTDTVEFGCETLVYLLATHLVRLRPF